MKAYTLGSDNNIKAHASVSAAAEAPGGESGVFTSEADFASQFGADGKRLIDIWNSLPGVVPVKKFKDRATGVSRIWAAIQNLGGTVEVPPAAPQTPNVAPGKGRAKKEATPAKESPTARKVRRKSPPEVPASSLPRESSKAARVIGMLQREGGATLDQIATKMGWQPHTTRALLSRGGAIYKKHGLPVTSELVDGKRRYKIG